MKDAMKDWLVAGLPRIAIIVDRAGFWHVRRVLGEKPGDAYDETLYNCDQHLGGPCTLPEAVQIVNKLSKRK